MLARYVIEHVFHGERDLDQLCTGALEHLRQVDSARTKELHRPQRLKPVAACAKLGLRYGAAGIR